MVSEQETYGAHIKGDITEEKGERGKAGAETEGNPLTGEVQAKVIPAAMSVAE